MIASVLGHLWFVFLLLVLGWSYWLAPTGPLTDALQSAVYVLAPLTAVISSARAAMQFGWKNKQGKALLWVTAGLVTWFVGEVLWVYYDYVTHTDAYPSAADYFYLVAYIGFTVGLLMEYKFLHTKKLNSSQAFLLTIIAALLIAAALYFGVYLAIKPDYSALENTIAISYGAADVILVLLGLSLVVVAMELRGGKFANAWAWFLAGLACTFIADIGFAWFTPQYEAQVGWYKPALDSLWIIAYLAMAYGLSLLAYMISAVQAALRKVK